MHAGDYLSFSADWPFDEREGDRPFVVSIVSRFPAPGRERPELGLDAPWILPLAEGLLRAGLGRAFADGYHVQARLNCPFAPADGAIDALPDAALVVRNLARTAPAVRYPITFWLCPPDDAGAAWAILLSNRDPQDDEAFHDALRAGGIWLSFGDIMIDVISGPPLAERVMRWAREAAAASGAPIHWDLWGED